MARRARPPAGPPKARNDQAAALWHRAGNAGAAVACDTRPRAIPSKRRPTRARLAALDRHPTD